MKKIARRWARAGSLIAVAGAAVTALWLPATASAAVSPLGIAVTSSQTVTSGATTTYVADVGVTYGITYTLKSNVTGATLYNVGFSDQLPGGVVLDDEVGETAKNCGTPFNATNQPGQASVTESGLTVVNGTSCTITLEFVASSPEAAAADDLSTAAFSTTPGGSPTSYTLPDPSQVALTPLALTVAGDPAISVGGVTNGASYGLGQSVDLSYSATAAGNDVITSGGLYATDDQGNTITSGAAVNTLVPGTHQLQVWVQTQDGYLGSQTLSYTVGAPKLTAVKTTKTGDVEFSVEFLTAGNVTAQVLDGKTTIGKLSKNVVAGRNTALTVVPTAAGKRLLVKDEKKGIRVTLSVLYSAADWSYVGTQPTIQKTGILLKLPTPKKPRKPKKPKKRKHRR